ncbi:MAG TPA: tetratricopeptide repeat protein [Kofleriaceae bacterium]|jgi:tetratricopeptide (TPR) repeat protein|nr:tetratricopeptide repeat protein [Kofleriaceae bacterium]
MIRAASVIVLALSAAAFADELGVPEKAKLLADRGRALHDAGDYAGAIAAYKEAYVLAPRPGLLFNLAQAYRLSGDCDDAAFMYQRFLDSNPPEDRRAIAAANLTMVVKCGHGGLAIVPPTPQPTMSTAAPALQPTASHAELRHAGAWIAVGGVAGLVVAGAFAWQAHEASDAVSQAYAGGMMSANLSSQDAAGRRDALVGDIVGAAGGAALITGAILYGVGWHDEARHVAVAPTTRGGEVKLSWAF